MSLLSAAYVRTTYWVFSLIHDTDWYLASRNIHIRPLFRAKGLLPGLGTGYLASPIDSEQKHPPHIPAFKRVDTPSDAHHRSRYMPGTRHRYRYRYC